MKEEQKTCIRHQYKTDFGYRTRHRLYCFLQKKDCDAQVNRWRGLCVANQQLRCWKRSSLPPFPSVFFCRSFISSVFTDWLNKTDLSILWRATDSWVWRFSEVEKNPNHYCSLQRWMFAALRESTECGAKWHSPYDPWERRLSRARTFNPNTSPFPIRIWKISWLAPLERDTARCTLL